MNECEQILAAQGGVGCLCIDKVNGAIVAGIQHVMRVYDPDFYRLIQTNVGHVDAVRSIIHIKERSQVISESLVNNGFSIPRLSSCINTCGEGMGGLANPWCTSDLAFLGNLTFIQHDHQKDENPYIYITFLCYICNVYLIHSLSSHLEENSDSFLLSYKFQWNAR